MGKKKEEKKIPGVWIRVPRPFLELFDREIRDVYPSRSEAIRRGMHLIIDEVKAFREETGMEGAPG